jgi:drug/metabolite transporter (DMT)-like permease
MVLGALGVLAFSFSFPATKLAEHSFDPWFIATGRAAVAGLLGAVLLRHQRAPLPNRRQWLRLALVAGGVVIGFPLLSSLALESTSSSHSAVVIAVLPAATAIAGAVRGRESPSAMFWLAAAAGCVVVTGYTVAHAGGTFKLADVYLIAGVIVCAIGYAEGGILSRSLGAPQTICWALLLAMPLTLPTAIVSAPSRVGSASAVAGFAYVSLFSMFLGFFCWYAGLARGGVARVSQLQLAQTPLTLVWSALVLGERIGAGTSLVAVAVLASVAATQRARVGGAAQLGARARPLPPGTLRSGWRSTLWPSSSRPSPMNTSAAARIIRLRSSERSPRS